MKKSHFEICLQMAVQTRNKQWEANIKKKCYSNRSTGILNEFLVPTKTKTRLFCSTTNEKNIYRGTKPCGEKKMKGGKKGSGKTGRLGRLRTGPKKTGN